MKNSTIDILKKNEVGYGWLIENDAGIIMDKKTLNESNASLFREKNSDDHVISDPLEVLAILQKAGVPNKNGRIYPREILEREVDNYRKLIERRQSIGESDHPESSIISNDRISHMITDIWWDKDTVMGKIKILQSPGYIKMGVVSTVGDKIAEILRYGVKIGVSSRGVGSVKEKNGNNIVQEDFELICWDVVTAPSTPEAYFYTDETQAKRYVESSTQNDDKIKKGLKRFLNG